MWSEQSLYIWYLCSRQFFPIKQSVWHSCHSLMRPTGWSNTELLMYERNRGRSFSFLPFIEYWSLAFYCPLGLLWWFVFVVSGLMGKKELAIEVNFDRWGLYHNDSCFIEIYYRCPNLYFSRISSVLFFKIR